MGVQGMEESGRQVVETWGEACGHLKARVCPETFEQWFQCVVPVAKSDGRIVLGVSDDFFAEWLAEHYEDCIREALLKVDGKNYAIEYEVGHKPAIPLTSSERAEDVDAEPVDSCDDEFDDEPMANERFTFVNFVVGEENRYAYTAMRAAATQPGTHNPLYLFGGTGLGKTHLLKAVSNLVHRRDPRQVVESLTCEEFLNLYVDSLRVNRHFAFRNRFRGADYLLIDDVHHLANKTQLQEEFFNTFNTLYNANKQIILTSDKQPCEIQGLEERLVSRFERGVTTEITTPGLETRLAILRMKQESQIVKLDQEILYFLASNITSNISRLEGALNRLVVYSSAMANEPVTIRTAERLLGTIVEEENSSRKISVENIQRRVAEHFDIRLSDLAGQKRPRNIAVPRMVAMYLARRMTDMSFPEIGSAFERNHATVIHAFKKIEGKLKEDEELRRNVKAVKQKLRG